MTEYAAAVSAFGNVRVGADNPDEAVEKLNDALADVDTGDLSSLTVDYVEAGADRWEQSDARERGIRK